uniref:Uncharacterized protein n=1 Tax=Arundo donax TaxID=35708 RepID=A0A0A9AGE6_ARUDO
MPAAKCTLVASVRTAVTLVQIRILVFMPSMSKSFPFSRYPVTQVENRRTDESL